MPCVYPIAATTARDRHRACLAGHLASSTRNTPGRWLRAAAARPARWSGGGAADASSATAREVALAREQTRGGATCTPTSIRRQPAIFPSGAERAARRLKGTSTSIPLVSAAASPARSMTRCAPNIPTFSSTTAPVGRTANAGGSHTAASGDWIPRSRQPPARPLPVALEADDRHPVRASPTAAPSLAERLVDRLVRDPHPRIIREVDREPVGDLLRAPRTRQRRSLRRP